MLEKNFVAELVSRTIDPVTVLSNHQMLSRSLEEDRLTAPATRQRATKSFRVLVLGKYQA
jgi:hypothetical protein